MKFLKCFKISLIIAMLIAAINVNAADNDILLQKLFDLTSYKANFEQTVTDSSGKVLQSSEGNLSMLRPNYFRMEITSPDESILSADGNAVYSYDELLEQVTIYDFSKQVADSPLMLLITKDPKVWVNYNVKSISTDNFVITPKVASGLIKSMELKLENSILTNLVVTELDGKANSYVFKSPSTAQLNESDLKFTIPKGVDIDDQRSK